MKILLSILCLAAPLLAQDALLDWMDSVAQQQLTAREQTVAKIRTRAEAEQRARTVRAKIIESIGGLPDYRGPLNARVTATITNRAYTLEKVIFESLPGFYVTANLYRPNETGRYPAVLLSAGHTTLGKTENHRIGANLAAKGFVALAYDPIGLGERIQALNARRRHAGGCCTNEHQQGGGQAQLIGQSIARYFVFDAMRAIDYLTSRIDVDADRIGAAGCSGGGCLTTYIAALDPRVKAAAPACYLNTMRLVFKGPFTDSEMTLPRMLANGLDHADFLELAAPKAWLMLATEGDFFTPAGIRPVYEETRRWYRLFGAESNVDLFIGPGPHGTPLETRERLYAFMIRWLGSNKQLDPREPSAPIYTDAELQVTKSGQVEDEPNSRKVHELVRAEYRAMRREPADLNAELRRIGVTAARGPVTNPKIHAPAESGRKPALLMVRDETSHMLADIAKARGAVVLELEPRDSPTSDDRRPFLGNWLANYRADAIGYNLPGMRASDILAGVDLLTARPDVDPASIRAVARGVKGVSLLLAAAADKRIPGVWIDRTPFSFAAALDRPLNTNLSEALIPGFLRHWDFADLIAAIRPRRVLWSDPADWSGNTVYPGSGYRYRRALESDDSLLDELFEGAPTPLRRQYAVPIEK